MELEENQVEGQGKETPEVPAEPVKTPQEIEKESLEGTCQHLASIKEALLSAKNEELKGIVLVYKDKSIALNCYLGPEKTALLYGEIVEDVINALAGKIEEEKAAHQAAADKIVIIKP